MAKRGKHSDNRNSGSDQMLRYLADKLSAEERHRFEREMLEDGFASEALEGLSSEDVNTVEADLALLKKRLKSRKKKQNPPFTIWRIAAALTLLLAFSFAIYYVVNSRKENQLAQEKPLAPALEKEDSSALDKTGLAEKQKIARQETDSASNKERPEDHLLAMEKKAESPREEKQKAPVAQELDKETRPLEGATGELQGQNAAEPVPPEIAEKSREPSPSVGNATLSDDALANSAEIPEVKGEHVQADKKATVAESKAAMARRPGASGEAVKTIQGNVFSSDDQQPVPGANVILKGTSNGVVSDVHGRFSIGVPQNTSPVLVISSIGYDTKEIPIKNQDNIQVTLHPDVSALSEVVVIGYGESGRENSPGNLIVPPKPTGGTRAFNDYIDKNLRYPPGEIPRGIKGTVKLKFTVETNGSIANIQVAKSLGQPFDQEAVRLLKDGPTWEPAKQNGSAVAREVTLKVRFRPPEKP